jgi:hypothetical protein
LAPSICPKAQLASHHGPGVSIIILVPIWACSIFALMMVADAMFGFEPFTWALALLLFGGGVTVIATTMSLVESILALMRPRRPTVRRVRA